MRIVMLLLVVLGVSGCGLFGCGSDTNIPPDMALACQPQIAPGDVCNPDCPYSVDRNCGCSSNGIWQCLVDVDGGI